MIDDRKNIQNSYHSTKNFDRLTFKVKLISQVIYYPVCYFRYGMLIENFLARTPVKDPRLFNNGIFIYADI